MGIYTANKVGRQQDDPSTRAVSVADLTADQYNAALVDENGTAFTLSAAEGNILDGVTATAAELNYNDIAALGTGAASKAVVLDADGDYDYPATATIQFLSGATLAFAVGSEIDVIGDFKIGSVAVTASAAELNKVDQSAADIYADGFLQPRVAQATWDFAVDTGAISAIDLGVTIPANSIILGGMVDVVTTCTSTDGGADLATGAISVEGANDIVTEVSIVAATDWDQGLHAIIPVYTAASAVKTTAAAAITFTIGTAAMTAGKFHVSLFYIPTVVDTA